MIGRSRTILDPLPGIKPRFAPNLQDYQSLAGATSIFVQSVDRGPKAALSDGINPCFP
jgi:hypothetical protein